jgi:hypothetical protein
MKTKVVGLLLLGLLAGMFTPGDVQSGLAGKWMGKQVEGANTLTWSMELTVKGNALTGIRTITSGGRQHPCEIEEGKVEGRLFSFKCEVVAPDGGNRFTTTFEGFINSKGTEVTMSPQKPASGGPVTLARS